MIDNPNPRYWRASSDANFGYVINFEKIALIFTMSDLRLRDSMVKVGVTLDQTTTAFTLHMPHDEYASLMNAYEQWLTAR